MPRWLAGLVARTMALIAPATFEAELEEEIQFHIEAATERNIQRGMTPRKARAAALQMFGSIEETKEQVRSASGVQPIQHLLQDQKHAVSTLRRQPRSALLVAGIIAISIGVSSAVFGVIDSVLLSPAPFPEANRVVSIFNSYPGTGDPKAGNSVPDFYDRRRLVASLQDAALYTRTSYAMTGAGESRRVRALSASPSLLSVLRISPALGRPFNNQLPDTVESREVLISHRLWKKSFDGSAAAIGKEVMLEGDAFTIVGVLPRSFRFSDWNAQLLTRLTFTSRQVSDAGRHRDLYDMIGRLRPGATVQTAEAELKLLNRTQLARYPAAMRAELTTSGFRTAVVPYLSELTGRAKTPLLSTGLGALVLLLIGTAAVVIAFVRRTRSRKQTGEGLPRFLRRTVTESTLLTLVGGLVGLAVAGSSLWLFSGAAVSSIPRLEEIALRGAVVAGSIAVVLAIGAVAGAASVAAYLSRHTGSPTAPHRRDQHGLTSRLPSRLVAAQIALSIILLVGAAIFAADAKSISAVDPGFDATQLVMATISLPDPTYADESSRLAFARRMIGLLKAMPSIAFVAIADQPPFSGGQQPVPIVAANGYPPGSSAAGVPNQTVVSEDYFDALSIDVMEGRPFRKTDDSARPRVAIVDDVLARRYWPDGNAIGQVFWRGRPGDEMDPAKAIQVVGIVEAVKQNSLVADGSSGAFYVPVAQVPLGFFRLIARVRGDPQAEWPEIRAAVGSLDPALVITPEGNVQDRVTASLAVHRMPAWSWSAFAVLGFLLSSVGLGCAAALRTRSRAPLGCCGRGLA